MADEMLRRMDCYPDTDAQTMLVGLLPARMSYAVMKQAGIQIDYVHEETLQYK